MLLLMLMLLGFAIIVLVWSSIHRCVCAFGGEWMNEWGPALGDVWGVAKFILDQSSTATAAATAASASVVVKCRAIN